MLECAIMCVCVCVSDCVRVCLHSCANVYVCARERERFIHKLCESVIS